ncbi:hypothetical protein [Mycoplasma sp. OR1901]|uniref:hypothetical protein n=1 Tax=Mycoplasma sp. OR1901 TaxID=2742195 RepID=UPI00158369E2|nr:hypothetical protein [Mycoplasma sp. OR1901]QKT05479.1 hypothetical protein HTZ87_02055 [Mycoplasma sp. OR1901]
MKRKFWVKTLSLALSSAGLVTLASCSSTGSDQKNSADYKKLQLEYKKYKQENEKNSKAQESEIERLKSEISESTTEKENKNNQLVELSGKIDELNRKIEVMSGTAIQRNGLSVRNLYNQISNFITSDFTTALKEQKPETYNKEKALLDQIVTGIIGTNAEVSTTEENFANLWSWESTVFHLLSRSKLIYEYIDDTVNPITVLTPKSEEMEILFQWRINDLNEIIRLVNAKPEGTYENKEQLLANLNSYVEKYQQAIDESSLLQHQISFWYNLEQDGDNGVANKFIDFSSSNMRSLLPSLKLSDKEFRISLFPVYKQIVDEKFMTETKKKVVELQGIYKQWLESNVKSYIYSVRFDKLYKDVKSIIDRINVILLHNNLTYFNEFNVWEDLDKFITEAKAVLLDGYLVDYTKEKEAYDNEVNEQLDKDREGSLYKLFNDKFQPLSRGSENNTIYLYKDFYSKYLKAMNQIKLMSTDTYQNSFLRYTKYQVVKKEIEVSKKIMDFYNLIGDDLNSEELATLLKLDNSAKYDKLIREATKNKARDEASLAKQKELLGEFVTNYDSENKTAKEEIENANETMMPIINEFLTKLNDASDENGNIIGEWGHMYGEKTSIVVELLNNLKTLLETSKTLSDSKDEDDDAELVAKMHEIVSQTNKFIKTFIGKLDDGEDEEVSDKTIINKFNDYLRSDYYDLSGEDYNVQTKIFLDVIKMLNDVKQLTIQTEKADILKVLNNKKDLAQIYSEELGNIFESGKPWSGMSRGSLDTVVTSLGNILNEFKSKTESTIEKLNSDNEDYSNELTGIINFSKEIINKIGSTSDGIPPIVEILKETLESYDDNIKTYERKKAKSLPLSKILASQEILVLLRYWKNNNKSAYDKIQLHVDPQGTDTYHDRDMANFLSSELKKVSGKQNYSSIMNVDGTLESFDVEIKEQNSTEENSESETTPTVTNEFFDGTVEVTPKLIFDKFKELETEYAKTLYEFLFNNENNSEELKNNLIEKRKVYNTFLNTLTEMNVFLSNSFIRFGSDLLVHIEDDPEQNFLLSDLLSYYANTVAVSDVLTEIHEKYIK